MTDQTWDDLGIDTRGRRSGQIKTRCPNCSASRKPEHRNDLPLSVNLDDGVYLCHNCGFTGALKRESWQRPIDQPRPYAKPAVPANGTLGPRGRQFLEGRGIDADMAAEAGVYTNADDDTLAFPYLRNGEIVHIKYRSILEKRFYSTRDTEPVMYGLDDCVGSDTILICEGELDRLAFLTAGFAPTLSVPNGAPAPGANVGAKLDCLMSAKDLLNNAKRVIIATDGDEPGQTLGNELVSRIGSEKCWRVTWPDGCKDANDVLMQPDGPRLLAETIDRARPEPSEGIFTGYDLESGLIDLYRTGIPFSYDFGYSAFDRHYRVMPGYMTVITGHAGHGKSTAFDQLLVRLIERHNFRVGIFSPEQQPLEWHQSTLISIMSGLPFFDGPTPRMSEADMMHWNARLSRNVFYILPEAPSIDAILHQARILMFQHGLNGLVIDPWNELEHIRPPHITETEYVAQVLGTLRNFARKHHIHVWLIAHPTKMPADNGRELVPGLGNISGSNNFRNKADFGLSVWRDVEAPDNPVDIHITKTRRREVVKLGAVRFQFNPVNSRLTEVGAIGSTLT